MFMKIFQNVSEEKKLFKKKSISENQETKLNTSEQVLNVNEIYKHVIGSLKYNTGCVSSDSEKNVELSYSDYKRSFSRCKKKRSRMCNTKEIKGSEKSHISNRNKCNVVKQKKLQEKQETCKSVC